MGVITFVNDMRFRLKMKVWRHPSNSGGYVKFYVGVGDYIVKINATDYTAGEWTQVEYFIAPTGYIATTGWFFGFYSYDGVMTGGPLMISDIELEEVRGSVVTWQTSYGGTHVFAGADLGQRVAVSTGGATITALTEEQIPIGGWFEFYNNSASDQLITCGYTLRLAGTTTTGTRTIAPRGIATIDKVAAGEYVISGAGVT